MQTSIDDTQSFKDAMRSQWDAAAPGWNAHGAQIGAWLAAALFILDLLFVLGTPAHQGLLTLSSSLGSFMMNQIDRDTGFAGLSSVIGLALLYSIRKELRGKPTPTPA